MLCLCRVSQLPLACARTRARLMSNAKYDLISLCVRECALLAREIYGLGAHKTHTPSNNIVPLIVRTWATSTRPRPNRECVCVHEERPRRRLHTNERLPIGQVIYLCYSNSIAVHIMIMICPLHDLCARPAFVCVCVCGYVSEIMISPGLSD